MASEAIQAAKLRIASAENGVASASQSLKSAKTQVQMASQMLESAKSQKKSAQSQMTSSEKELADAMDYLKSVEKKWQVIDVDLDSGSEGNGDGDGGDDKKKPAENGNKDDDGNGKVDTRRKIRWATNDKNNSKVGDSSAKGGYHLRKRRAGNEKENTGRKKKGRSSAATTSPSTNNGSPSNAPSPLPRPSLVASFSSLRMKIYVKALTGNTITFDVKSSDTVYGVKTKLHDKEGIVPERQRLIYGGTVLEDRCSLSTCNIQNHAVLHLVLRPLGEIPISVETVTGKAITFNVKISDTVLALKSMINNTEDIPTNRQRLIFAGNVLEDSRPLSEYSIQRESTLHLISSRR